MTITDLKEIEKIDVNKLLKSARTEARLTQQAVADALGIDRSTYTYCEKGRTKLDIIFLLKVCSVCGISLEALLNSSPIVSKTSLVSSKVPEYLFNSDSDLSEYEQKFLAYVRKLDDKDKDMVFDVISRLADSQ